MSLFRNVNLYFVAMSEMIYLSSRGDTALNDIFFLQDLNLLTKVIQAVRQLGSALLICI